MWRRKGGKRTTCAGLPDVSVMAGPAERRADRETASVELPELFTVPQDTLLALH